MAMPRGPLVVLSPAFVAPYETTFLLQERVGRVLPTVSRTHPSLLVAGNLITGDTMIWIQFNNVSWNWQSITRACGAQVFNMADSFDV